MRVSSRAVGPASRADKLLSLSSPSDTKTLIETAVNRFLEEVPALQPLKLVVGLELRGRGDVQLYRDAPLLLIGEGTSEIQRMVIGRKLLERHKI